MSKISNWVSFSVVFTLHLNEKNLSTNSPWGFEHIFDTMDYYLSCPDESFFHRTLPTRWCCDHFSQKCPKSKLDTTFWYKKTSLTPTFCIRNSFRMHRFGAMNFLLITAPFFVGQKTWFWMCEGKILHLGRISMGP